MSGALTSVGALALGYDVTSDSRELTETIRIDTTIEDDELRRAICGQPIRPGQRRGPNEDGEIVHDDCKESVE